MQKIQSAIDYAQQTNEIFSLNMGNICLEVDHFNRLQFKARRNCFKQVFQYQSNWKFGPFFIIYHYIVIFNRCDQRVLKTKKLVN